MDAEGTQGGAVVGGDPARCLFLSLMILDLWSLFDRSSKIIAGRAELARLGRAVRVVAAFGDSAPQRQHGQAGLHLRPGHRPAHLQRQAAPHGVDDLVDGHVGHLFAPLGGVAVMAAQRVLDPSAQLRPVHRASLGAGRLRGAQYAGPTQRGQTGRTSRAHCHQLA